MYCIIPTTVSIKKLKVDPSKPAAIATFRKYLIEELGWSTEVNYLSFEEIQEMWYSKFGKHLEIVELS